MMRVVDIVLLMLLLVTSVANCAVVNYMYDYGNCVGVHVPVFDLISFTLQTPDDNMYDLQCNLVTASLFGANYRLSNCMVDDHTWDTDICFSATTGACYDEGTLFAAVDCTLGTLSLGTLRYEKRGSFSIKSALL